jgi:predicted nucleic acid-binding protein
MRRVILDSNALDPLIAVAGAYEALESAVKSANLEIFFTHVTVDEIAATSDLEKRQWLLNLLVFLGRPIYASGAVLDISRLNFCRLMANDDDTFEPLRSGNIRHSRDALIAHTAMSEGCALITNDKRLAARARDQGVEVLTTVELLAEFGYVFPAASVPRDHGSSRSDGAAILHGGGGSYACLRSGVLVSSPRLARWEPPRGVPVSNRRGLVTSPVQAAPWLMSSRQPTGVFGRPERERQLERRPGRRVGGASGPPGPP